MECVSKLGKVGRAVVKLGVVVSFRLFVIDRKQKLIGARSPGNGPLADNHANVQIRL